MVGAQKKRKLIMFQWYKDKHTHRYYLQHLYDSFDVAEVWYGKEERGWIGEVFFKEAEFVHKTLREAKEEVEEYLTRFVTDFQQYLGG